MHGFRYVAYTILIYHKILLLQKLLPIVYCITLAYPGIPFLRMGSTTLGVVIQLSGTDTDVHRQMRKSYAGINTLVRRFYACSYDVKCYLFRYYISNMYCGQFWFNSTKYCLNKPHVSYNNSCRRLLRLPMRNSSSEMFVQCNILLFGERLRK